VPVRPLAAACRGPADVNVSANAIKKYESIKHKKNFWVPVKNQKKKRLVVVDI
jgi:hypothetical protein